MGWIDQQQQQQGGGGGVNNPLLMYEHLRSSYKTAQAIMEIAQLHTSSLIHQIMRQGFVEVRKNDELFRGVDDRNSSGGSGGGFGGNGNVLSMEQRTKEKLILLMRSLRIMNFILHTIRNRVQADLLEVNENGMEKLIMEINESYKQCLLMTSETTAALYEENCEKAELSDCCTVDSMVFGYAVRECKVAVLNEMDECNLAECVARYNKALLLLDGVYASTTGADAAGANSRAGATGVDKRVLESCTFEITFLL